MSEQTAFGQIPQFTVADRMRKAREMIGLGQAEFADELGISRSSVSNYETGATQPRKIVVKAVALRTGVPISWLETGNEKPHQGGPGGAKTLPRLDSNQRPSD